MRKYHGLEAVVPVEAAVEAAVPAEVAGVAEAGADDGVLLDRPVVASFLLALLVLAALPAVLPAVLAVVDPFLDLSEPGVLARVPVGRWAAASGRAAAPAAGTGTCGSSASMLGILLEQFLRKVVVPPRKVSGERQLCIQCGLA